MLSFWPSDAVLVATQAGLVCGPRPALPPTLLRLRSSVWAWILLPLSLGGTIALLAVVPALADAYAWVAVIGVPLLAAIALGHGSRLWLGPAAAAGAGLVVAGALLALAWAGEGLAAQGAAVALTALSTSTIASYLAQLAPSLILRLALVAMAVLDCILVFGQLLQGPNDTLNAASVGAGLPHLQVAHFGHALMGYGDFFTAAVLGAVLASTGGGAGGAARQEPSSPRWPPRWVGAVLVFVLSALFDLLFFVVDELPATVPVAVALVIMELWRRRVRPGGSGAGRGPFGLSRQPSRRPSRHPRADLMSARSGLCASRAQGASRYQSGSSVGRRFVGSPGRVRVRTA